MHAKIKSLSITTIVVRVPNKSSSDKKKASIEKIHISIHSSQRSVLDAGA